MSSYSSTLPVASDRLARAQHLQQLAHRVLNAALEPNDKPSSHLTQSPTISNSTLNSKPTFVTANRRISSSSPSSTPSAFAPSPSSDTTGCFLKLAAAPNRSKDKSESKKRKVSALTETLSKLKRPAQQSYLDFGQAPIGVISCECGSIYQGGNEEDRRQHAEHHDRFVNGFVFEGWKHEPLAHPSAQPSAPDERILCICARDIKNRQSNVGLWLDRLYSELGQAQPSKEQVDKSQILASDEALYVYIKQRRVVGLMCVKEHVPQAYKIDPNAARLQIHDDVKEGDDGHAQLGIDRIWTLESIRRQGVARSLLRAALRHFSGMTLTPSQLAFSQPTSDGRNLAESFTNAKDFLAYRD